MSKNALLPMDSYRLAQYSVPLPCYICGGDNTFDAEFCRNCQAPLAITRQALTQKAEPQLIATLGSACAGKTVYLGMLTDMLSRERGRVQLLARGAFSVTLQQHTVASLSTCEFPDKTPNEPDRWNWVHCQTKIRNCKQPIDMVMPDLAGEALLEEINHPNSYPVVRLFLKRCASAILLVDVSRLEQGDQDQDFLTMKIVSYLCELIDDRKKGWAQRPVAVVFTKADQCEPCFADPAEYARKHTPGLWQLVHERLLRHRYFASGVAGACLYQVELGGRRQIPLRIEPRGIVEPFLWVTDQLRGK